MLNANISWMSDSISVMYNISHEITKRKTSPGNPLKAVSVTKFSNFCYLYKSEKSIGNVRKLYVHTLR